MFFINKFLWNEDYFFNNGFNRLIFNNKYIE